VLTLKNLSRYLLVLSLLTAVACAGGGGGTTTTTAAPAGSTLVVQGIAFGTAPTVRPGDTFTIDNQDSVAHTFTSSDDSWESVDLAANSKVQFTVPADLAPGRYVFFCRIHSGMGGALTVEG
jgi:plastocyanin